MHAIYALMPPTIRRNAKRALEETMASLPNYYTSFPYSVEEWCSNLFGCGFNYLLENMETEHIAKGINYQKRRIEKLRNSKALGTRKEKFESWAMKNQITLPPNAYEEIKSLFK